MEVRVFDDISELGLFGADLIVAAINHRPDAVIGFATGSTPLPVYRALENLIAEQNLDLSQVHGFALDEYADIDEAHPESYHSVIGREVIEPLGLTSSLVEVLPATASEESAAEFEAAIVRAGGVDVQILGIGRNGHLAFNEPGSPLDSRTRRITLTPETIADNARFFDSADQVPSEAITQGLGTIMESRKLLIIATGAAKAQAVAAAISGPVTEDLPASIVQRHPDAVFLLDREAASLLN